MKYYKKAEQFEMVWERTVDTFSLLQNVVVILIIEEDIPSS